MRTPWSWAHHGIEAQRGQQLARHVRQRQRGSLRELPCSSELLEEPMLRFGEEVKLPLYRPKLGLKVCHMSLPRIHKHEGDVRAKPKVHISA